MEGDKAAAYRTKDDKAAIRKVRGRYQDVREGRHVLRSRDVREGCHTLQCQNVYVIVNVRKSGYRPQRIIKV